MKKVSTRIPIYFCKIYVPVPIKNAPLSLLYLKEKMGNLIYWGVNMDIKKNTYVYPALPSSFYEKVNAKVISISTNYNIIRNYVGKVLSDVNITGKYLLLTGTVVHDKYYTSNQYQQFIDKIIDIIGSENIVSKCHPRYKDLYGKEKLLAQIPSFIPGNLLIGCFDYFIGFESTLLVEVANAGKIAISLIDFLKPEKRVRECVHIYFRSRLNEGKEIFFPKTIDELIKILK